MCKHTSTLQSQDKKKKGIEVNKYIFNMYLYLNTELFHVYFHDTGLKKIPYNRKKKPDPSFDVKKKVISSVITYYHA